MRIFIVCPACEDRFEVEASLRGQTVRCPNAQCRHVFTVPAEEPPTPAAKSTPRPQPASPGNGQRTGLVGDLVPLVEAKAVESPAPAAKAAPSWQVPPPVRRPTTPAAPTPAAPEPVPAPPAAKTGPREMPAGTWDLPPVRRGPGAAPATSAEAPVPTTPEPTPAEASPEPAAEEEQADPPVPVKRTGWIVGGLLVFVVVVLGVGGGAVWFIMGGSEGYYSRQAEEAYKTGQFSQAAGLYDQLQANFPASDKHDYYRLMQGLSELRSQTAAPDPDVSVCLDQFNLFIAGHNEKDLPLLKERAPDLGDAVGQLADSFAQRNTNAKDDTPLLVADQLENAMKKVAELNTAVPSPELKARFDKDLQGVRDAAHHLQRLRAAFALVQAAANVLPPWKAVRAVRDQIAKLERDEPGFGDQPDVKDLRERVYAEHLKAVTYQAGGMDLPPPPREIDETRFIVNAPLRAAADKAPANDPVVLAAARGILYALKRTTGQVRWAVSVGVDTTALPVRVPEAEGVPERILVVSADAKAVDALDGEGNRLWRYRMGAECIGRPLIVGNVAYLAAYDGKVHEIELAQGKLLGVYDLGQPLTVGGAIDPVTNLLYFPADDFCVYAIDPRQHQCFKILYTGHPAGSVRGEPLIVTPDPQLSESWLVLNQARGLDEMQLRVYALPIKDREEAPEKLDPEPLVPGWTWFPPYHDGEKLAMLGDTGVLGLFGIRQARNPRDPPLFPMLPHNLTLGTATAGKARGRAEVVAVQGQDFWVLAGGTLQRLFLGLDPATGPHLTPVAAWQPQPLGSPLHASQVETDPVRGGTTLVLTTQPLTRQTCLTTAVDDRSGDILWQRQLGLVCQGEPVELRPPGSNASPVLVALDQGGGLVAFDPARYANLADGEWREGGQLLFEAMDDGPAAPPMLLPGPDGRTAYEIASPGDGTHLVIRRVEATATGLVTKEFTIALPAPLAGTPAVTEGKPAVTDPMIVLPLADGFLGRLTLPLDEKSMVAEGPAWRGRRAPPDARGRVTATGPDTFLAGDGARSLTHWQWSQPKLFHSLPAGKDTPTLARKDGGTLTADPVLLPEVPNEARQVCIAAVGGGVTILTVGGDGSLKEGRNWDLGGPITAGPFVQVLPDGSPRIACVVNETQLVWLDPAKNGELWRHPTKPGAHLVGQPRLAGGLVVVADESGRIVGLDPKTGEAGPEYLLQGSAAPAASPVGFGADRLFVPLTDGTVLLPKVERIRKKEG